MRLASLVLSAVCVVTPAAAEVLVGVAAPLTGRFAEQGAAIRKSVEEVVARANALRKGQPDEIMKVEAVDDLCEAEAGREAAHALIARKVAVVIGHNCASAALAAAPVYAAANTLLISLTRHPDLTDKRAGPTIFRMAGRDDRQGEAIARYLTATFSNPRVAFVHDRTQYAKSLTSAVQRKLAIDGIAPVLVEEIVAGERDYGAVATRVQKSSADVVVFAGYPSEARVVLRSLRAKGLTPAFIAGDAIGSDASLDGLEGAVVVKASTALAIPGGAASDEGHNPYLAMIATRMWQTAVGSRSTANEPPLAQVLQSLTVPLAELTASTHGETSDRTSRISFAANGDAGLPSFRLHKIVDGRISPAE